MKRGQEIAVLSAKGAKRIRLARAAAIAGMALSLGGCAGGLRSDNQFSALPDEPGRNMVKDGYQAPVQCAPYAREHSDVKLYGDAWTWWDKAAEKFPRGALPRNGSVMVLSGYAASDRAHVAVVRKIISEREIRIDHANWLDDGSIYLNDPVVDVSPGNDWSVVKVWNIKSGAWGHKTYPVQGFIGGAG